MKKHLRSIPYEQKGGCKVIGQQTPAVRIFPTVRMLRSMLDLYLDTKKQLLPPPGPLLYCFHSYRFIRSLTLNWGHSLQILVGS